MKVIMAAAFVLAAIALVVPVGADPGETEKERQRDGLAIRNQIKTWDDALVAGEYEAMSKIFSDDYFKSEGVPRKFYAEMYRQMGVTYRESNRDNLQIRFYGDTAIVTGQWTSRGDSGQFGSFASTSHMTDIWVKQDGTWKCVAVVPSQTRQAFSRIGQVRVGPDVIAEIVVVFGVGVSEDEINTFRGHHLSENSDPPMQVASYARPLSIDGHAVVALKLANKTKEIEREFLIERMLKDPLVFRVFENVAPNGITIGDQ